jgi:hypothetical protein
VASFFVLMKYEPATFPAQPNLERSSMATYRVFTWLMTVIAICVGQFTYAQSFEVSVQAIGAEIGETVDPRVVDERSGQTPVSAMADYSSSGTTVMARASAGFNFLGARASGVASLPQFNSLLGGFGTATWRDTLFFHRVGGPVTSGSVRVTADIDGLITELGDGAAASATLHLIAGSSSGELSFGDSGTVNETLGVIVPESSFLGGLPVQLQLRVGAGNQSLDPSTAESNFSSTARITSVAYLTPEGQPDTSVTITSASGVVYGIPEPTSGALAVMCLCIVGGRWRR